MKPSRSGATCRSWLRWSAASEACDDTKKILFFMRRSPGCGTVTQPRSLAGTRAARPEGNAMSNPHEIKTVKCAHCGKVRPETNHRVLWGVEDGRISWAPLGSTHSKSR